MNALRACPHCGNAAAPMIATAHELGDDNCAADNYTVVCSMIDTAPIPTDDWSTGCGATGGYADTPEKAAALWNRMPCALPNDELKQIHAKVLAGMEACSLPNGAEDCTRCPYDKTKGECLNDGMYPDVRSLFGAYEAWIAKLTAQLAEAAAPKTISIEVGDGAVGFLFSSDEESTHPALVSVYDLGGPHPIGTPVPTNLPPVVQFRFSKEASIGIMLRQLARANSYLHDTALVAKARAEAEADMRNEVRADLMNKVRMALRATPVAPAAQDGPFDE